MQKMSDEEREIVEGILAREKALNYELEYDQPESLPLLAPADRAAADAKARETENRHREPTEAEVAEVNRLLGIDAERTRGMAPLKQAQTVDEWYAARGER